MKRWLALLLVLALAACTTITKVEGEHVVHGRLAVQVSAAWNKINDPWVNEPYDTWTQEGLPLDHLRLWGGVKNGEPLVSKPMVFFRFAGEKDPRVPTFRSGMSPEKLVNLFEQLYANAGTVRITKVEPAVFAGEKGVRFEFSLARRGDDLSMRGVGGGPQGRALCGDLRGVAADVLSAPAADGGGGGEDGSGEGGLVLVHVRRCVGPRSFCTQRAQRGRRGRREEKYQMDFVFSASSALALRPLRPKTRSPHAPQAGESYPCLIATVFKVVKPYSASKPFSRP
jgi:hypothetical protein